ncbi:acyltransferase family protein [Kribbia dieselivorans]|uniref:acyltransferase family protein n=1 Tax=Kribbia dieselivorans TaxID=331526 RepID=UPI0008393291|nr:acyltransferase family protein [Kribbia dieselivorans]
MSAGSDTTAATTRREVQRSRRSAAATPAGKDPKPKGGGHRAAMRGDIEGLRAIAVLVVLIYHLGVSQLSGGFVGVDIFFVISGFLITSQMLREIGRDGTVSLTKFYSRRARRLLPAASTVLLFTAVVGWFVLPAADRANLASDVITATFYVINWALAFRAVDYLAEDAGASALQHYWSLSVEEQFYVIWPLLMLVGLFLAKKYRLKWKRLLFLLLCVTALASFIYSVVHTRNDPATAYFFTTTRIWELAIGALISFAVIRLTKLTKRGSELLAGIGLVLIVLSLFIISTATPWPSWWAALPTVGAGLIIAAGCAHQDTYVGRFLGMKWMVWIGGISYAVYLWHWPLVVFAKALTGDNLSLLVMVLVAGLSVFLAWATKHLIEDPVRFHPVIVAKPSRSLIFGGVLMAITGLVGTVLWFAVPRVDPNVKVAGASALVANPKADQWQVIDNPTSVFTQSGSVSPDPAVAVSDTPSYYDDNCQVQPGDNKVNPNCTYGNKASKTSIALLGDSKMGQWMPAMNWIASKEDWRVDLYLKSACSFSYDGVKDDCAQFGHNVIGYLKANPDKVPTYAIISQGSPSLQSRTEGMEAAITDLQALGTKVVLLADNTSPAGMDDQVYNCVADQRNDISACDFSAEKRDGRGTPPLKEVSKQMKVPLIDLNQWVCPPGRDTCPPVIGGTMIYRQGSHITATYVRTMAPMLHRGLAEVGYATTPVKDISATDVPVGKQWN